MERRFSQGLAMLFGYTYSKAIDNVGEMTSVAGTRNGFQDNYCFVAIARVRSESAVHPPPGHALRTALRAWQDAWSSSGLRPRHLGGWSLGGFYTCRRRPSRSRLIAE